MEYGEKAVSHPMPGVAGFSLGIWQQLVAQTSVHPFRLRVSGGCSDIFPEGKTTALWLKFRILHFLREKSTLQQ